MVNIKGMDKVEVLDALYVASKPQGLGILHFVSGGLTDTEKKEVRDDFIKTGTFLWVDYLKGRVLKVNLNGDEFDERLYDRDNGEGAAQRAVRSIPNKGDK